MNKINLSYFTLLCFFTLINLVKAQYPTVRERIINLPNFDEKTLHYGYFVGVNSYDYKFEYNRDYYVVDKYTDLAVESNTGFNVGLIGDLRINKFFNLRIEPGLIYTQRNLMYPDLPIFESNNLKREIKSTYIHIPLLIKMSAKRINNFKPYLTFGFSMDYNLSSNSNSTDDNLSNVFRTVSKNINYELGLGFDFYLYYFKFSPSIRGIFSTQNELIPDFNENSPWTSNIKKMFTRGFVLNFTFE